MASTTHGYHIPGTPNDEVQIPLFPCGGFLRCGQCNRELTAAIAPRRFIVPQQEINAVQFIGTRESGKAIMTWLINNGSSQQAKLQYSENVSMSDDTLVTTDMTVLWLVPMFSSNDQYAEVSTGSWVVMRGVVDEPEFVILSSDEFSSNYGFVSAIQPPEDTPEEPIVEDTEEQV